MKLYLCVVHWSRNDSGTTDVAHFEGLVFADSEEEAIMKSRVVGMQQFPTAQGWYIRTEKAEEVQRSILERAAREILGWDPPSET